MTTITVKNIPADLYVLLKHSANLNRRSINSEIIFCLERALQSQPVDVEKILGNARKLREGTSAYQISDEELNQAKSEGRT